MVRAIEDRSMARLGRNRPGHVQIGLIAEQGWAQRRDRMSARSGNDRNLTGAEWQQCQGREGL